MHGRCQYQSSRYDLLWLISVLTFSEVKEMLFFHSLSPIGPGFTLFSFKVIIINLNCFSEHVF